MKTLFAALFTISSFFMVHSATAHESTANEIYTYDKQVNPAIRIDLESYAKKAKNYYIRDNKNKIILKGDIEEPVVYIPIRDLEPGQYYIEVNGYKEKVIIK